jgi:hypothetical protein
MQILSIPEAALGFFVWGGMNKDHAFFFSNTLLIPFLYYDMVLKISYPLSHTNIHTKRSKGTTEIKLPLKL